MTGTPPTVVGNDGDPYSLGNATPLTFISGIATTSIGTNGVLSLYLVETAVITAADAAANIETAPTDSLTVTVSTATASHVEARDAAVGGAVIPSQAISAGTSIDIYAVALDPYRNVSGTVSATWDIATTEGVSATTDISPTTGISTTFTGHKTGTALITPTFGSLIGIPTGVITVTPGIATMVRVETSGDGLGDVVASQSISSGTNIPVWAVTRDAFLNFVANPVASWTVITPTGGVIPSDMEPQSGASSFFRGRAAGSGYIEATVGVLTKVTSGQIVVGAGEVAYLKLTAPSTTFTAGVTRTLSITAYDGLGNLAVGYDGDIALTFSGAQPSTRLVFTPTVVNNSGAAIAFGQPTTLTFASGVLDTSGTAGDMTLYAAGTNIPINASDGTYGSAPMGTLTVTVSAAARERLDLTVPPQYVDISGRAVLTAGTQVQLTIRMVDHYGNPDPEYDGNNVRLVFRGASIAPDGINTPSVTDNLGDIVLFTNDTKTNFTDGVASTASSAGRLRLYKVETTTIHVRNPDGVDSAPNGGLAVRVLPSLSQNISLQLATPQVISQTFTGASRLFLRDQYQNPVTNYNAATRPITITGNLTFTTGTIQLAGSGDDNVLNEDNDVVNGTAVLTMTGLGMVYMGLPGTATFTAAAAPQQAGQANIAAGTSGNVTINSGPPTNVTLQGALGAEAYASALSVEAGKPISLQVSLRDAAGNLTPPGPSSFDLTFVGALPSGGVTPTVTNNGGAQISFGQPTTLNLTGGVSAVADGANGSLRLYKAGVYTITATGTGVVTPPGSALVVTVTPGPLAQLDLQLTSPQTNTAQFKGTNTLTVRDAFGNTLENWSTSGSVNVTFTVPASSATIQFANLSGSNQLPPGQFSAGVANLSEFNKGMVYTGPAGPATIQAQAGVVTGTADVEIRAGPLHHMDLQLTSPQTVTQAFVETNTLTVRDVSGNPLTDWSSSGTNVNFSVTSPGGSVTFSGSGGNSVLEPVDFTTGRANLSAGSAGMVYSGTVGLATIQAQTGSLTTNAGVTMNPGSPAEVTLRGGFGAGPYTNAALSVEAGQPISLQVSLRDAANNLTPLGAANFDLTFAGVLTTGVTPPDPTVTNNGGALVAFGQPATLGFNGGVSTVTPAGANGRLTLYEAGVYTITATGTGVATSPDGEFVVTVTPGPLAQLDLQLTELQTNTQEFVGTNRLTVLDSYGNVLKNWSSGPTDIVFAVTSPSGPTIDFANSTLGSGNLLLPAAFTAGVANLSTGFAGMVYSGTVGLATIQAQSGSVVATADVTINPGPLAQLDLQLTESQTNTEEFVGTNTVTVRDASGNVLTDWSSGSANVTFAASGGASLAFNGSGGDSVLEPGNFTAGVANLSTGFMGVVYTGTVGTAAIQAQSGSVVATADVLIEPGPLAQLDLVLDPSQTEGVEFVGTNTLTVRDASGNVLTDWNSGSETVTFTATGGAAVTFNGSGFDSVLESGDFPVGVADLSTGFMGMVVTGAIGPLTIQAQSGSVTGTAEVTINAPP